MSPVTTPRAGSPLRGRLIGVAIVAALFVFLISRFLPEVYEHERGFVAGETVALEGTVHDKGRRPRRGRKNRGIVDFFPHVDLPDGRRVVLETAVSEDSIPAIGQPIALRCLRSEPGRCRMDTREGVLTNSLGFGAIGLIWLLGMGTMAVRILRSGKKPARAGVVER